MNRRKQGNRALEAWDQVLTSVNAMDSRMREMLVRDRFATEKARSPLLGAERGSQGTAYADPTGETAVEVDSSDLTDPTHRQIVRLALLVRVAQAALNKLADLSDIDVRKRASRNIPECMIDGELVYEGRVKAGFCERHYKAWARKGRPDRVKFISEMQAEAAAQSSAASVSPVKRGDTW